MPQSSIELIAEEKQLREFAVNIIFTSHIIPSIFSVAINWSLKAQARKKKKVIRLILIIHSNNLCTLRDSWLAVNLFPQ